jgi:hypothetical protein
MATSWRSFIWAEQRVEKNPGLPGFFVGDGKGISNPVRIFRGVDAVTRNISHSPDAPLRPYGASLFFQEK